MLPDPGGRQPAPPPLRIVQQFVNTLDIENGIEELATPVALRDVLVRIGALPAEADPLTDRDLHEALAVREGLRKLLLANNGVALDPDSLRALERAARAARLGLRFDRAGAAELQPAAHGVEGALGRILAVVYTAMADGSWERLKACRRDVCHWVFYDKSKNRSSTWCSMAVCGNRTKIRAYRARRASHLD